MNGLNFGGLSSSTTPLQLNLLGAHPKCMIYEDDDYKSNSEEEDSLEGESYDDGKNTNTLVGREETLEHLRDVLTFFRQFIPIGDVGSNNNLPLQQPMSALQNRYNTLQHRINKQARVKSIKSWFKDTKLGDSHPPALFTSSITIPNYNICAIWGLKSRHFCSGQFHYLTTNEKKVLNEATGGKDLLLDICGEYMVSETNAIQFKSKKAAQKSAALNLLFAIAVGELIKNENERPESIILGEIGMLPNDNEIVLPKERFQLENIQYYGSVKDPEGEFLSRDNPCLVQCIVSVRDMICNDLDKSTLEVTGSSYQNENDSLNDASDQLKCILVARGSTDDEINNILSAMRKSKPHIAFEMTLPKWSTAKLQTELVYVYELEFSLCNDGSEIPLSEAMGLDPSAATRFGIICGDCIDEKLCADFVFPASITGKVCVTMCNQTQVTSKEMMQQIKKVHLSTTLDPIILVKCFNRIIFDNPKNYGMGAAPVLDELLDLVTKGNQDQPGSYRTSMFVPLCPKINKTTVDIDWKTIVEVTHHTTTNVVSPSGVSLLARLLKLMLVWVTVIAFSAAISWLTTWKQTHSSSFLLAFAVNATEAVVSTRMVMVSTSLLLNRFLIQPTLYNQRVVFIATKGEINHVIPSILHAVKTIMPMDIETATLRKLWKCYVRYPLSPVIRAQRLGTRGMTYARHESSLFNEIYGKTEPTFDPSSEKFLVPHQTLMLPMPRDMLYLCQYATVFMPKLERAHNVKVVATKLLELQQEASNLLGVHNDTPALHHAIALIDKATSICNKQRAIRENERLEILGDSVYGFFIVLNVFAKVYPNNVPHVLDLFEEVIKTQGKNKSLFRAGMQIRLHRALNVDKKGQPVCQKETSEIAKKQISNFMESMIGAAFLIDNSGATSIGLLNQIGPFLPTNDELDESLSIQNDAWFVGAGTCIHEGYPFSRDPGWSSELKRIEDIVQNKQRILSILQSKAVVLVEQMNETMCRDRVHLLLSDPTASLLLYAALFDDAIDEESDPDTIGMESLANLRDKIFHVGNAALQLSIVSEIYQLYPTITSGDIHLFKAAIMTHDTLAYVCVKNTWHKCLFDSNADAPIMMQDYMNESEVLGAEVWAKHGGWSIMGGHKEFQRRVKQYYGYCTDNSPQYSGLAAGRLWGHKKKLPDLASDDLQFSMKCIVGSLVLSLGAKEAWDIIRPFFLELLLLSPCELRNSFDDVSDLVGNYKKGKR